MLENSINQTHLPVKTSINTSLNSSTNPLTTESFFSRSSASVAPEKKVSNSVKVDWAKSIGGAGSDGGRGIAVDGSGNVYTTGTFSGSVDLDGDGIPEVSADGSDIFVIKQNASDGSVSWAKSIDGRKVYGIAVDDSGNVYTSALLRVSENLDLDGDGKSEINAGELGASIIKQNANDGSIAWVKSIAAQNASFSPFGVQIGIDGSGNVYATGSFSGKEDFDGDGIYTRSFWNDIFIIKYNGSDGSVSWAKSFGSEGNFDRSYGIAVDGSGNVYTTGSLQDSADLNGDGNPDINAGGFVIKHNGSDGSVSWARSISGSDFGTGIAVDGSGNIYTTGSFSDSADLDGDGTPEVSAGRRDIFVIKQDGSDGSISWAKSIGSRGDDIGYGIAVDDSDNVYTFPSFRGPMDLDEDGIDEVFWDRVVIKHNSRDGSIAWTKSIIDKSRRDDIGYGIAVDDSGNIYTTGTFDGYEDLDKDGIYERSAGSDIFILKLAPDLRNNDETPYYLQHHSKRGTNTVLSFDEFNVSQSQAIAPVREYWQIVSRGDFNGDGQLDVFWRKDWPKGSLYRGGQNTIWLLDGLNDLEPSAKKPIIEASIGWEVITSADFNGDGKDDILWQNKNTGEGAIWFMDGFNVDAQFLSYQVYERGWQIQSAGDFDGDGKADIVWRNEGYGRNAIWLMDGKDIKQAKYITTVTDRNWEIKNVGDVNGDGKDDIIWHHRRSGETAVWFINTDKLDGDNFSIQGEFITDKDNNRVKPSYSSWILEMVADYNGDGKEDFLWRNDRTDELALWWMDGAKLERGEIIQDSRNTQSA